MIVGLVMLAIAKIGAADKPNPATPIPYNSFRANEL
jgi:hypothetical protein